LFAAATGAEPVPASASATAPAPEAPHRTKENAR